MRPTDQTLRSIRDSVAFVGRMSDSIVHVGPFRLGIDGVLSWIPGVGEVYSTLAGVFIVAQGVRAGVPLGTLAAATVLLACRTLISSLPVAGAVASDMFLAHRWAAGLVVRAIDRRLASADPAEVSPWGLRIVGA